jgi:hypothetical protein
MNRHDLVRKSGRPVTLFSDAPSPLILKWA